MPLNATVCPELIALGFNATTITNQVKKNSQAFDWYFKKLSDEPEANRKAYAAKIFAEMTDRGAHGWNAQDIGRTLGLPASWVQIIMDNILAAATDLHTKGEL